MGGSQGSSGGCAVDACRERLADLCARADLACKDHDVAEFVECLREAIPLVAESVVSEVVEIVVIAQRNAPLGMTRWQNVREHVTARREVASK